MSREPNGQGHDSADLSAPRPTDDALIHWDDLDEQLLRMLSEDPVRGKRLRKLVAADDWLRSRASDAARRAFGPSLLECPHSDELYDFGMGPGAVSLSAARREAIDRHLATCRDCEGFVATLTAPPPSPLILDPLGEPTGAPRPIAGSASDAPRAIAPTARPRAPVDADEFLRTHPIVAELGSDVAVASEAGQRGIEASSGSLSSLPARRRGPTRLAAPLVAAAAILVAVVGIGHYANPTYRFPEPVVLRGSDAGPVLFPRDRVLVPSAELRELFPALGQPPVLEVESQVGADAYRFEIQRVSGGAFGKPTPVGSALEVSTPVTTAPGTLAEGEYVLKVFAVVRELAHPLKPRGFQMVRDDVLDARLRELGGVSASQRTLAAIALLDECGYATDARTLARTMPASPERDRYLARPRGR